MGRRRLRSSGRRKGRAGLARAAGLHPNSLRKLGQAHLADAAQRPIATQVAGLTIGLVCAIIALALAFAGSAQARAGRGQVPRAISEVATEEALAIAE